MLLPLSQLLATGRAPDHQVANRAGIDIPFAQFQADVAHNTALLRAANCRAGAPVCRDSYWFLVGFLALCHAGATIIIPSNTQPGTLEALSGECDLLLVDQPSDSPAALPLEEGGSGPWRVNAYDPKRIDVNFYTSGSTGSPKRVTRTAHHLECEVNIVSASLGSVATQGLVSGMVSHHHVYGMLFRLLWPLSRGLPFSSTTHDVWETCWMS